MLAASATAVLLQFDGHFLNLAGELVVAFLVVIGHVRLAIKADVRAFVGALVKARPSGAKGTYVKKIAISSTMGPGVMVDQASLES